MPLKGTGQVLQHPQLPTSFPGSYRQHPESRLPRTEHHTQDRLSVRVLTTPLRLQENPQTIEGPRRAEVWRGPSSHQRQGGNLQGSSHPNPNTPLQSSYPAAAPANLTLTRTRRVLPGDHSCAHVEPEITEGPQPFGHWSLALTERTDSLRTSRKRPKWCRGHSHVTQVKGAARKIGPRCQEQPTDSAPGTAGTGLAGPRTWRQVGREGEREK